MCLCPPVCLCTYACVCLSVCETETACHRGINIALCVILVVEAVFCFLPSSAKAKETLGAGRESCAELSLFPFSSLLSVRLAYWLSPCYSISCWETEPRTKACLHPIILRYVDRSPWQHVCSLWRWFSIGPHENTTLNWFICLPFYFLYLIMGWGYSIRLCMFLCVSVCMCVCKREIETVFVCPPHTFKDVQRGVWSTEREMGWIFLETSYVGNSLLPPSQPPWASNVLLCPS